MVQPSQPSIGVNSMKLFCSSHPSQSGSEHSAGTVAVMRTALRSFTWQHLKHARLRRVRYADSSTRSSCNRTSGEAANVARRHMRGSHTLFSWQKNNALSACIRAASCRDPTLEAVVASAGGASC